VPAVGRVPGTGGYGLDMIADLTSDHGRHSEDPHKTVWAATEIRPPPDGRADRAFRDRSSPGDWWNGGARSRD
jgi:hypothetical protein